MPFINNTKMIEIRNAAKQGNEKALMILQAMRKQGSYKQDDIDRLVNDYYEVGKVGPETTGNGLESKIQPENDVLINEDLSDMGMDGETQPANENAIVEPGEDSVFVEDLTEILDGEMDGLLDETEIEDLSFNEFLSNKSRDNLRMSKNADYFKAYDAVGRENYMNSKIGAYRDKFKNRLGNVERNHNDYSKALQGYMQGTNDMLDDNVELDMNNVNAAYKDFTNDETVMSSFGRHWDEVDNDNVMTVLKDLVSKYGKKNVIATLNTISGDNDNYRDFLNNQIDTEINRYSKSLEKLLK